MADIFSEGYQACKGRNQSTYAAYVYAHKKVTVIACKLREKDRRRYIADKLAWKGAEKQSAFIQQTWKESFHKFYSCHISRENKKENECQQKRIINLFQRIFIRKEKHCRNDYKAYPERNNSENDNDW